MSTSVLTVVEAGWEPSSFCLFAASHLTEITPDSGLLACATLRPACSGRTRRLHEVWTSRKPWNPGVGLKSLGLDDLEYRRRTPTAGAALCGAGALSLAGRPLSGRRWETLARRGKE